MFSVGDYVVYKLDGVCQIKEIATIDTSGKLYYIMERVNDPGCRVYSPVDNQNVARRPLISAEELDDLLDSVESWPLLEVTNERNRESCYMEALKSGKFSEWGRILKTIYTRKQKRSASGKKSTSLDERYLDAARKLLVGEVSVALKMNEEEALCYLKARTM